MPRWLMPLALIAASSAWGGSLVYTTLTSWQSSSPGSSAVLDFESSSISYYGSYSSSPYTFTAAAGGLYLLGGAASGTGSGHYLTTDGASTILNIALATGIYGVAFNLGSNSGSPATGSILATDINGATYLTGSFTTSGPSDTAAFWGLRNDVQLASIRITFVSPVQPQIDNVRYSSTALPSQDPAVPEPGTWILAVSSLGLVLLLRNALAKRQ